MRKLNVDLLIVLKNLHSLRNSLHNNICNKFYLNQYLKKKRQKILSGGSSLFWFTRLLDLTRLDFLCVYLKTFVYVIKPCYLNLKI